MSVTVSLRSILLQCFGCKRCRGTVNKKLISTGIRENMGDTPYKGASHKPTLEIKQFERNQQKYCNCSLLKSQEDPVIKRTVIKNNSLLTTASATAKGGGKERGRKRRFCHRRQSRLFAGK